MSVADIVLLSDCTGYGDLIFSRYSAPYVLATRLRAAGFGVRVIDYFTRHPDFFPYLRGFLGSETLFIGLSSTFLSQGREAHHAPISKTDQTRLYHESLLWHASDEETQAWLARLKATLAEASPAAALVLGGVKAAQTHRKPQTYAGVLDYVVLGPADDAIVELARALRAGRAPPHSLKEGVRFVSESESPAICPATVLKEADAIQPAEALPVEISRGCLYDCKFCYYDKKRSVRKDLALLREELLRNYEGFGTTVYHFCDDCFNDTPDKVEAVCGMLRKLPFEIEWVSYARPDVHVKRPELLDLMIEAGCRGLYYGLETFNHAAGKAAGKAVPPEAIKRFFSQAYPKHRHRALFDASFVIGLPHETAESQRQTTRWLIENKVFDHVHCATLAHAPYDSALDKLAVDYADHVRHPDRYGFSMLPSRSSGYWRHATMDLPQAAALQEEMRARLDEAYGVPVVRSCFMYPAMRTLGFTPEETLLMAREGALDRSQAWLAEAQRRTRGWLTRYWDALAATRPGALR